MAWPQFLDLQRIHRAGPLGGGSDEEVERNPAQDADEQEGDVEESKGNPRYNCKWQTLTSAIRRNIQLAPHNQQATKGFFLGLY